MKKFKNRRHIAKAITWRMIGTLDTIILSWIISGDMFVGFKVGGVELVTKIILYYLHDRAWYSFFRSEKMRSSVRHAIKAMTWRFFGTLDTIILGYLITGNLSIGIQIGSFELLTKTILYFFHERIWHRSNFGLINESVVEESQVEEAIEAESVKDEIVMKKSVIEETV